MHRRADLSSSRVTFLPILSDIARVGPGTLPARRSEDYDHVSFLVPGLHIPVSLGDLLQRIASIYYCPEFSGFDQALEETLIFEGATRHSAGDFGRARYGNPHPSKHRPKNRRHSSGGPHTDTSWASIGRS